MEGIDVRRFPVSGGSLVRYSGEFEQRESARYAGVPWPDFEVLPAEERALILAHYRLSTRLEQVLADRASKR